eukprot:Plantae.Rhodophyta-Hildenbrandia_rubra.ctg47343.p1 GENE.Plantae.Rhodophyta-Hildenbrandia_rubra.ctg47343~~Plantae.Rhodophyta-Hildenbrandia_rubra.ctg47343.p1  ORF type:complete len:325 (-),score=27.42 Plantae.Rhodophyta-Hildenbrandia_rubra.ctg47343:129-1103(-)
MGGCRQGLSHTVQPKIWKHFSLLRSIAAHLYAVHNSFYHTAKRTLLCFCRCNVLTALQFFLHQKGMSDNIKIRTRGSKSSRRVIVGNGNVVMPKGAAYPPGRPWTERAETHERNYDLDFAADPEHLVVGSSIVDVYDDQESNSPEATLPSHYSGPHPRKYLAFLSHQGDLKLSYMSTLWDKIEREKLEGRVFFDEGNMALGSDLQSTLRDALGNTETLVVILTREFIKEFYPVWEVVTFLDMMKGDKLKKILPVFYGLSVKECKKILSQEYPQELKGKSEEHVENVRRLLRELKNHVGIDRYHSKIGSRSDAEINEKILSHLRG